MLLIRWVIKYTTFFIFLLVYQTKYNLTKKNFLMGRFTSLFPVIEVHRSGNGHSGEGIKDVL